MATKRLKVMGDLATKEYVDKKVAEVLSEPRGTVKTVNNVSPDDTGNVTLDIETAVLHTLVALGTAPVVQDNDGSVLVDSDDSIIVNN